MRGGLPGEGAALWAAGGGGVGPLTLDHPWGAQMVLGCGGVFWVLGQAEIRLRDLHAGLPVHRAPDADRGLPVVHNGGGRIWGVDARSGAEMGEEPRQGADAPEGVVGRAEGVNGEVQRKSASSPPCPLVSVRRRSALGRQRTTVDASYRQD